MAAISGALPSLHLSGNGRTLFPRNSMRRGKCVLSAKKNNRMFIWPSSNFSGMGCWSRGESLAPIGASPFDVVPPPIDHDLQDTMQSVGAKTSEDGTVESFGNDEEALNAAEEGVVVVDLSHFGRIRVSGGDRINFLHNQSTANFQSLLEGQGCDTVFVTPTARTIDIAHAWIMKNAMLLLVSDVTCSSIIDMLRRYIFFSDRVELQDLTKDTCFFTLMGPKSTQVIKDLNLSELVGKPYGTHLHYSVNKMPVTVSVGSVLSEEGFSFLLTPANAEPVWKALLNLGAVPMGTSGWERLRVLKDMKLIKQMHLRGFTREHFTDTGRPAPGKELTDEFNVLEASLWKAVSLSKGCYKGQETIARLVTYDGVKQKLWGVHLDGPAEPGTAIIVNGKKVGKLTSYSTGSREPKHAGLGYVKKQVGSVGLEVAVGDAAGALASVPFLSEHLQNVS